ncbi:hypothetical protein ABNQ39_10245 [Azospirillum sp. A26]|uniref:hypothetical protein n=1 Tax=Azospirillum sp. A26 TaxID=3160607 RepID=UPI00366F2D5B
MLTGVFAKAAKAKDKAGDKAGRKPGAAPAPQSSTVAGHDPAVRLSLGPGAVEGAMEDAAARPFQAPAGDDDLADRLDPAIRALARDLGRLLTAFGMGGSEGAVAETALAARFGDAERRAAVAALDGPAGALQPLADDARQDVAVELSGIGLVLSDGTAGLRLDNAALALARVPAEEKGEGLAAMLGALRSAIRPGKGLTVETDRVAIDDLGRVMEILTAAIITPPQGLEGTVTLSPLGAPADGGAMELALTLSGRLGEAATAAPPECKPAKERPPSNAVVNAVGEGKERGFDVRI